MQGFNSMMRHHSPKMTAKRRRNLPDSTFGIPSEHKYPLDTRGRQINAKGRAKQMVKRGKLSSATASKIIAKANRLIGKGK